MTTITIHLPESDSHIIASISEIVKKVNGGSIDIDSNDDGLTQSELDGLKRSLKEVAMIKKGELEPLSMDDLWND
jgi:hypothetical protein